MGITSFSFWLFLCCGILIYFLFPVKKYQWFTLLGVSVAFFVFTSGWRMILYMLWGVGIAWASALVIERASSLRLKRIAVIAGVVLILAELASLKYVRLGMQIANLFSPLTGKDFSPDLTGILAPIGISYYTLSITGYLIEVYWGNISAERNFLKFMLFAIYFPQLTSGPITRYADMNAQLTGTHSFDHVRVLYGIQRILWGLFKKIVVADRAAVFVSAVFNEPEVYQGYYILLAILLFALQLYADFSGCMDIICGASECFGIMLPENFNSPFLSETVSEFWDRWHITMGLWFRDFLLYPLLKSGFMQGIRKRIKPLLGKKAAKNVPTYLSMSVVWILIGIWHGGENKYILASGLLPGFYLIMGQICTPLFKRCVGLLKINTDAISWHLFRKARTFFCLCTSWVFVRAQNVRDGLRVIKGLFARSNMEILFDGSIYTLGLTWKDFNVLYIGIAIMIFVAVRKEKGIVIRERIHQQNLAAQWIFMLTAVFTLLILGMYGPQYNAADFIYKNF